MSLHPDYQGAYKYKWNNLPFVQLSGLEPLIVTVSGTLLLIGMLLVKFILLNLLKWLKINGRTNEVLLNKFIAIFNFSN